MGEHVVDALDLLGSGPVGRIRLPLLLVSNLRDRGGLCGAVRYFAVLPFIMLLFIFLLRVRRESRIRAALQGEFSCLFSLKALCGAL